MTNAATIVNPPNLAAWGRRQHLITDLPNKRAELPWHLAQIKMLMTNVPLIEGTVWRCVKPDHIAFFRYGTSLDALAQTNNEVAKKLQYELHAEYDFKVLVEFGEYDRMSAEDALQSPYLENAGPEITGAIEAGRMDVFLVSHTARPTGPVFNNRGKVVGHNRRLRREIDFWKFRSASLFYVPFSEGKCVLLSGAGNAPFLALTGPLTMKVVNGRPEPHLDPSAMIYCKLPSNGYAVKGQPKIAEVGRGVLVIIDMHYVQWVNITGLSNLTGDVKLHETWLAERPTPVAITRKHPALRPEWYNPNRKSNDENAPTGDAPAEQPPAAAE